MPDKHDPTSHANLLELVKPLPGRILSPHTDLIPQHQAEQACRVIADGAPLGRRDRFGRTALHLAAQGNKPNVVAALLSAGAEVDAVDTSKNTPLMLAANKPRPDNATLLLAAGADIHHENSRLLDPLYFACLGGDTTLIRKLVDAGADPNRLLINQTTFQLWLLEGFVGYEMDVLKQLLDLGADTMARDGNRQSARDIIQDRPMADEINALFDAHERALRAQAALEQTYAYTPLGPTL